MEGKTHAIVGAASYVALANKLPGKFSFLGMFIVVFAALLPDIDHPKSLFNKYILPIKNKTTKMILYFSLGVLVLWFDYLYTNEKALKALGISFIFIGISSHRNGLTHSLIGLWVFGFVSEYFGKTFGMPQIKYYVILGYSTHLICDSMTKMGLPLFYPFLRKKIKLPLAFKVGSKTGKFIEGIISTLALVYMVYMLPSMHV
ncbi:inner membrane protein [Clostridium tepidiprofundi DSM 19306]|uniref:Inner membrane protein n=1 Tax=Clostridium tepidiprofundi DSM 19306 TaxID=1121338 RepID=A0A151B6X3_9CLOT|nr:metal-dependent hydrolase [Clostridium tepidiprofundi]KYH35397.1 inner membrane protein [Clostridium tepidiprofundi DSM 19306]